MLLLSDKQTPNLKAANCGYLYGWNCFVLAYCVICLLYINPILIIYWLCNHITVGISTAGAWGLLSCGWKGLKNCYKILGCNSSAITSLSIWDSRFAAFSSWLWWENTFVPSKLSDWPNIIWVPFCIFVFFSFFSWLLCRRWKHDRLETKNEKNYRITESWNRKAGKDQQNHLVQLPSCRHYYPLSC